MLEFKTGKECVYCEPFDFLASVVHEDFLSSDKILGILFSDKNWSAVHLLYQFTSQGRKALCTGTTFREDCLCTGTSNISSW